MSIYNSSEKMEGTMDEIENISLILAEFKPQKNRIPLTDQEILELFSTKIFLKYVSIIPL